jgi:hypothetical protein
VPSDVSGSHHNARWISIARNQSTPAAQAHLKVSRRGQGHQCFCSLGVTSLGMPLSRGVSSVQALSQMELLEGQASTSGEENVRPAASLLCRARISNVIEPEAYAGSACMAYMQEHANVRCPTALPSTCPHLVLILPRVLPSHMVSTGARTGLSSFCCLHAAPVAQTPRLWLQAFAKRQTEVLNALLEHPAWQAPILAEQAQELVERACAVLFDRDATNLSEARPDIFLEPESELKVLAPRQAADSAGGLAGSDCRNAVGSQGADEEGCGLVPGGGLGFKGDAAAVVSDRGGLGDNGARAGLRAHAPAVCVSASRLPDAVAYASEPAVQIKVEAAQGHAGAAHADMGGAAQGAGRNAAAGLGLAVQMDGSGELVASVRTKRRVEALAPPEGRKMPTGWATAGKARGGGCNSPAGLPHARTFPPNAATRAGESNGLGKQAPKRAKTDIRECTLQMKQHRAGWPPSSVVGNGQHGACESEGAGKALDSFLGFSGFVWETDSQEHGWDDWPAYRHWFLDEVTAHALTDAVEGK